MAKKKINPEEPTPRSAAPARRRAPARKKTDAAPPIDVATVAGTEPRGNGRTQPTQAEIAEAAYFRHLKRGGTPGNELNDWIEAERELRARRSR
ncbi:MAG: DUF2934 domain-containing protein [Vicinamibacterales bacterium]